MFVDNVKIYIKAGDGGNGAIAFHREKYVSHGGPSGGRKSRESTLHIHFLLLVHQIDT